MSESAKKIRVSYADYLADKSGERYELLDGEIVMQAAPSRIHQKILGELFRQLANFLDGKKCEVYSAPFDVRLFEEKEDTLEEVYTVLQPDILVVCDIDKLDDRGCKGAPDLVMEILSPSTARHDWIAKWNQYQKAGVREYWIIDPQNQLAHVFLLKDGRFSLQRVYSRTETAQVNILDGCFVDLNRVFPEQSEN